MKKGWVGEFMMGGAGALHEENPPPYKGSHQRLFERKKNYTPGTSGGSRWGRNLLELQGGEINLLDNWGRLKGAREVYGKIPGRLRRYRPWGIMRPKEKAVNYN